MIRLFVGLPVPLAIATAIEPLQRGVPGARWRNRHQFHITLGFIGEVDERTAESLDLELGQIAQPAFDLSLAGAGLFGGNQPDSLWLGVEAPAALAVLHQRVTRAARRVAIDLPARKYVPHVTIAYLPPRADPVHAAYYVADHGLFRSPAWTADRFYLYASHMSDKGSHYTIEAEYPLVG
ncbi:MAG: RNA 2',3'-cyclic phosphodiesterase [Hyphomonadaceae bacterium]|jgi:2'-5' RNA ligase|nr:RNA 2',3'-cyclic phosphodiesterase [Hyphomonadaceae bacterium]